jgi:hypothetical protein
MENLIIKNLLDQIEKLNEENKRLTEENVKLRNNIDIDLKTNDVETREVVENKYSSIEDMISEKYCNAININDFEVLLKSKITEKDLFDCLYKNVKDVVVDVLTRELSNKEIRPLHKNKYYIVKTGDVWFKQEYFDFDKIVKRLINIVVHTMMSILYKLRKSKDYINGGSGIHAYKDYRFDYDEFKLKVLEDLNHQSISKLIGNRLHVNL